MTVTVGDAGPERQSSPPTRRVVEVMSLVVQHAESGLSLADIVRSTGIPRGTAHAVATQLCALGWLTRHPDNSFTLGLDFLATSRRAALVDIVATAAAPAVRSLIETTGSPAFLAQRDGDSIAVNDHLAPDSAAPSAIRRMSIRPPLCREFVAWADDDTRTAWLDRAPADQRPRLRQVLAAIRDRGYSIERTTDHHRALIDALGEVEAMPAGLRSRMADLVSELSAIDYLPAELAREVGVVSIGAPIFDEGGEVVAALVSCPDATMTADALAELGGLVTAAADAVTATTGGIHATETKDSLPPDSHRG